MPDTPPPIRARISCSRESTYVRIIFAFAGTLIKNSQLRVMKLSGSIFVSIVENGKSFKNIVIIKKKKNDCKCSGIEGSFQFSIENVIVHCI